MGVIKIAGAGLLLGQNVNIKNPNIALAAGQTMLIPPGQWMVSTGDYSTVQYFDPITDSWQVYNQVSSVQYITSDGFNFRVANTSGCVIAGVLTTAGAGYTAAPIVTPSAGGSTWVAVMGQVVASASLLTPGANYTYPPLVVIDQPPVSPTTPVVAAQAVAQISGGVVTGITIVNAGAGYGNLAGTSLNLPNITIVPDPRDPNNAASFPSTPNPIQNATAVAVLAGQGTVNAVICTNHGSPVTAVPTLTFTGGGSPTTVAVAQPIMNFALTGATVSGGTGYTGNVAVVTTGGVNPAVPAYPAPVTPYTTLRQANIQAAASAGALTTATVLDAGLFQAVPSPIIQTNAGSGGTATLTVGGVTDTVILQTI